MTKNKLEQNQAQLHHLDAATQAIITKIDKNDRRLRTWAFVTLVILMILGVAGIYRQTMLATENTQHIDCIIKDLSTPIPAGSKVRTIDYETRLQSDCKIKFN